MRTATVILDMTEAFTEERMKLPVNVVEVREREEVERLRRELRDLQAENTC